MISFCRFLLVPAALLFATACSAQEYVPALSPNCVTPTYVQNGNRFTNDCGVPVYVSIVFGYLRTGAYGMQLENGKWGGTGHSEVMTDRLGGAFLHVCPEGSIAVDQDDKPVYRVPVKNYRCRRADSVLSKMLGLNTLPATDAPSDIETQALAHLGGSGNGVGLASGPGADLEQQALAKLGGSTKPTPITAADLERQALGSLSRAQAVMSQAQATMDAQARREYGPNQPTPLTVVFRGDGTDSGSDSDSTETGSVMRPKAANAADADQIQQALRQQLQNIQQVANTIQQRQTQPAPGVNTPNGAGKSTVCEHIKPGQACLAQ